MKTHKR